MMINIKRKILMIFPFYFF